MAISESGLPEVKNLFRLSVERVTDLRPVMEAAAARWEDVTAASFSAKRSPDGTPWEPRKDGTPAGVKSGTMARSQGARALSTGLQGLTAPFYSVFFKGGTALGNRAAGLRKKKSDRLRRRRRARGTSRRGIGPGVQPPRPIAPIEVRSRPYVIDDEYFQQLQDAVARYVAAGAAEL